jgi:hypothetical protein
MTVDILFVMKIAFAWDKIYDGPERLWRIGTMEK